MPVLIVDSVNRTPADNPPGATDLLAPPTPTEFEVASLRPSQPGTRPTPPPARQFQPAGRLYWLGVSLRDLIVRAWDLDPDPHAAITGAPKWLESEHFDLVAKAPVVTLANGAQAFSDDLPGMLRALLMDRYKMAIHYEERPVEVYTLVAVKPKMKKADSANRPGCKMEPRQPPREPGAGPPAEAAVCQNVTMAQFAERLQAIAKSYIRYPVVDGTGLDGAWDFRLVFHPAPPPDGGPGRGIPKGGGPPPEREPDGESAADAMDRISLFTAIEKELGLKLQAHKRPMRVLVIDHIERKPTEN